jgi:hypothetical protein
MQGEDVEIEYEQTLYARPIQDTQPPDPGALPGPRYHYPRTVSER